MGEKILGSEPSETDRVRERYQRRMILTDLYNPLNPSVYMAKQERERALIRLITEAGLTPVNNKRVLEVGCGSGSNILQLIELGFNPELIVANELLEERVQIARKRLPPDVQIIQGDASELKLAPNFFDIVLQSTVFTSLLDVSFQQKLANKIWELTKPGGAELSGMILFTITHLIQMSVGFQLSILKNFSL